MQRDQLSSLRRKPQNRVKTSKKGILSLVLALIILLYVLFTSVIVTRNLAAKDATDSHHKDWKVRGFEDVKKPRSTVSTDTSVKEGTTTKHAGPQVDKEVDSTSVVNEDIEEVKSLDDNGDDDVDDKETKLDDDVDGGEVDGEEINLDNDDNSVDSEKAKMYENDGKDSPRLTAYIEPIYQEDWAVKPLPIRNTTSANLTRKVYDKLKSCKRLQEQWPTDDTPTIDDPYLPWIHDVFPTEDGKYIQFVAQNRRRCQSGTLMTGE